MWGGVPNTSADVYRWSESARLLVQPRFQSAWCLGRIDTCSASVSKRRLPAKQSTSRDGRIDGTAPELIVSLIIDGNNWQLLTAWNVTSRVFILTECFWVLLALLRFAQSNMEENKFNYHRWCLCFCFRLKESWCAKASKCSLQKLQSNINRLSWAIWFGLKVFTVFVSV